MRLYTIDFKSRPPFCHTKTDRSFLNNWLDIINNGIIPIQKSIKFIIVHIIGQTSAVTQWGVSTYNVSLIVVIGSFFATQYCQWKIARHKINFLGGWFE